MVRLYNHLPITFQNLLYNKLPIPLQNAVCSFKGFYEKRDRFGGDFSKIYQDLIDSQWKDKRAIDEYKLKNLQFMVNYCYEAVPYYTELFNHQGLHPKDIEKLKDIENIPILTKDLLRENFDKIQSSSFNEPTYTSVTSGSTGKAIELQFSKKAIKYRWAIWFRHRHRFGVKPSDKHASFIGLPAVPLEQEKPPYWRENYPMNRTIFTMHHISREKVPSIVSKLNSTEFTYYSGYPSILYSLAQLITELGLEITKPPKVIFTGAEALLENQRKLISQVFKTLVTDQYGFSEGCGNASRCEEDHFHEDFEYGILECHNPTYNSDGSKTGDILATGFTNHAMPLLRYQVGDIGTWKDVECKCGRKSDVILRIEGRNEDYVITPEGTKILRFDYLFKETKTIREAQVIQKELGEIIIKIVPTSDYNQDKMELELLKNVKVKISQKLGVSFEYVDAIPKGSNGKFRAVISELKK